MDKESVVYYIVKLFCQGLEINKILYLGNKCNWK